MNTPPNSTPMLMHESKQFYGNKMTITELYSTIQALQYADKLRLMQFLLTEFAREEQINFEITEQSLVNIAQPLGDENLARNFENSGD